MTAPTIAVEWLLARAAVRSVGLLHVVSERSSGLLNPICGANQIRSERIERRHKLDDLTSLCPGCATMAASIGGTVRDGVALLLGLSAAVTVARLLELPIADIDLPKAHARREPGILDDLVASVTERGVVAPIVVRRQGDRFEVIDGARRVAAAHLAHLSTVPAVVRDATDRDVIVDGIVANLHRQDLNPIDAAHAYVHAIDTLGLASKAELGRLLGISREQVSNTIRLLELPQEEQDRIAAGDLSAEGGRALLRKSTREPDPQLTAIQDLLAQVLEAKVAVVRTRGVDTEIVLRVPTADRDRWLQQLALTA